MQLPIRSFNIEKDIFMSRFLEFHVIQNFAPSNLNRDDTGAPKDALFGGHRRARVSSQCLKRTMRETTRVEGLIPAAHRAVRTRKLQAMLLARLTDRDPAEAAARIEAALGAAGLLVKEDGLTEYLLFLGESEIDALAQLVNEFWDALPGPSETADKAEKGSKKNKKEVKAAIPPEIVRKASQILEHGGKAVDIALYGRMLADLPAVNQYAACQVAHAISTHRVEREFDYYTAVDDWGDAGDTGAGMIGQVEFNSATFYRYAVIDLDKLLANLQGDRELALAAVEAFTRAIALAIPSGKQNAFAARNLPDFLGVCLRHGTPLSLANAFEKPVVPRYDRALTEQSVEQLLACEARLGEAYGSPDDQWLTLDLTGVWPESKGTRVTQLGRLAEGARGLADASLGA